jgi:hypothetical protein
MSWVCYLCSNNNDDRDEVCVVCDAPRPLIDPDAEPKEESEIDTLVLKDAFIPSAEVAFSKQAAKSPEKPKPTVESDGFVKRMGASEDTAVFVKKTVDSDIVFKKKS